jgi:peptidylprolyl isomerase
VRRFAALLAAPLLLLAACGDDGGDTEATDSEDPTDTTLPPRAEGPAPDDDLLDGIEVSGEFGEKPEVTFETPLESDETVRRVLSEGDGEPVAYDEDIGIDLVLYDAENGEEIDDTFDSAMFGMTPLDEQVPPFLAEALLEAPMGSRIVSVLATAEFLPEGTEAQGPPTMVLVADIHARAEVELDNQPAEGLPQTTLFNFGEPEVEIPDEDPPAELSDTVLIEGDGAEIKADDYLLVNYHGVLWEDGEIFDSSYANGAPAEFPLDGVIDGWAEGLTGQTVGSTVLVVVPPDKGYGEEGQEPTIPGDATLVFVVEILEAIDQEEAAAAQTPTTEAPPPEEEAPEEEEE